MKQKSEKFENKSIGETIDNLLNNPQILLQQYEKIIKRIKDEVKNVLDENKNLKMQIIEKDKDNAYLYGKIDGMEYIIEHLNLKV